MQWFLCVAGNVYVQLNVGFHFVNSVDIYVVYRQSNTGLYFCQTYVSFQYMSSTVSFYKTNCKFTPVTKLNNYNKPGKTMVGTYSRTKHIQVTKWWAFVICENQYFLANGISRSFNGVYLRTLLLSKQNWRLRGTRDAYVVNCCI